MSKADNDRCATGKTRLHVSDALQGAQTITLGSDQSHYLVNVLRLGKGDAILLFNGRDGEWLAHITEAHKKNCQLQSERQTRPQENLPDIWLLFAPVKRARLDFIAQKATEMGAAVIQPVFTDRTIVTRLNDDRLQANAIEAAEQCGLLAIPETREPEKLENLLANWSKIAPGRHILFCDESETPGHTRDHLQALAATDGTVKPFAVLIGPEGGFSPREREMLRRREDTMALSLGPRIMRADTAAIAALAVVGLILGDW